MDRRIADIFGCIQVEIAIIRFDDGRIRQTVIDHRIPIAPVQTVAPNHEPETNPLDELCNTIDTFRNKLKLALDESTLLVRKVKEVQLAQKQKERDFIQAKRTIERIRMAI